MAKDKKQRKNQETEPDFAGSNCAAEQTPSVENGKKKGKKSKKMIDDTDDLNKGLAVLSLDEEESLTSEKVCVSEKSKKIAETVVDDSEENKKSAKSKHHEVKDGDRVSSRKQQSSKKFSAVENGIVDSPKMSKNAPSTYHSDEDISVKSKDLKGKKHKSSVESETLDILENRHQKNKGKSKKSKGKQQDDENDDEEFKSYKSKPNFELLDVEDDDSEEHISVKVKGNKGKKHSKESLVEEELLEKRHQKHDKGKNKKIKSKEQEDENELEDIKTYKTKSVFALLGVESDGDIGSDEKDTLDSEQPKVDVKTSKKSKKKDRDSHKANPGFELLDDEKGDIEAEVSSVSDLGKEQKQPLTEEPKAEGKGGKKSKKKERKRKDEDDDDLDKILQELALEMEGKKPEESSKDSTSSEIKNKSVQATSDESENQIKKKGSITNNKVEIPDDISLSSVAVVEKETKSGKKKKKKKDIDAETLDEGKDLSQEVTAEEEIKLKTAAQKKKEKKEKEKQKKVAQYEQGQTKKKVELEPDAVVQPVAEENIDSASEEKKDDDDSDKKKRKKKKDEDEKKDKKRPGKKQIAAMQEALRKVREEEERLRLEEEARIKAAEEAERLRQEKLRLEQERKEKKKQKEKEKRERLKAEGKLLTKTQRQNRARMEATLAALRQQGVEVPQIGEKRERVPRLGDKKKLPKRKVDASSEDTKNETETVTTANVEVKEESPEIDDLELEGNKSEDENVDDEDEVKDAWDESTGDEDESEQSSKVESIQNVSFRSESKDADDETDTSETEESSTEESDSDEESEDESEDENKRNEAKMRERAYERIKKRREDAEISRNINKLRSPVVCVLGHVDTGKTKILDKIRRTHVQDSEAGGITQQIGATMVPQEALKEQCKMVKNFSDMDLKVPGLLIIDTPGHESFSNLRSRGSSLCDIAVLVVDIMHGLEPQTIESLNLLRQKKTPFIVALNKIDRLYEWKSIKNKDIQDVIKSQARNTKLEFDDRVKEVILQFANQGLNAVLFYDNKDPRSYISMVPTSALTGDGMGNLMALIVHLTQTMMTKRLAFSEELQATVLEVKAIPGLGTTIDVILVNGRLHEGDTVVLAGHEGAMVTQIRSLLMPQPLKELRVKNPYQEFKEVEGSQGVKITGKDLDKAIAGLQLLVAHHPDEIPILKDEITSTFKEAMSAIKLAERGVYVQASTLGSLEALLDFLKSSKIPYSGIRIGPVVKKDVMKASIMLEHDSQYAVILAFDVRVERDAQELADSLGVKIFQADIIYHLFDKFMAYREELKNKKRDEFKNVAVFPCKLRILPQYIFNSRDPIVVGVIVEAGIVKEGTPLCVPSKEFLEIGTVSTIEVNHKQQESARKGQEVCIKIEPNGGEAPKMYGRHFDHTDMLVSKITRQSIDVCKEYFRDDLLKTDWQLMVELKKTFQIL